MKEIHEDHLDAFRYTIGHYPMAIKRDDGRAFLMSLVQTAGSEPKIKIHWWVKFKLWLRRIFK